jgi:WD40 repeat protein
MFLRTLGVAAVGGLALSLAACDHKVAPVGGAARASNPSAASSPTDIGEPLYTPEAVKPRPEPVKSTGVRTDPIIVRNCQVTLPQTQNVPSKNDGKLMDFCTDVGADEKNLPDQEKVLHPRTGKPYRRLHEGAVVKRNQLIAIVDDSVPAAKRDVAIAAKAAAEAKLEAAIKLEVVAKAELDVQVDLKQKNATTNTELRRSQAQWDQSIAGIAEAKAEVTKSEEELKMANVLLGEYEIRASTPGMIKRFYRRAGEAVKALEPVAEIQNLDLLRVEGLLDYQHLSTISQARDLKVQVEPAPQLSPKQYLDGHLQPVRAVAVNKDKQNPLIVSGSEDKTVRVWDRNTKAQVALFVHGVPVRAVACTPSGAAEDLCLTGADDGIPRLYDLTKKAPKWTDGDRPKAELKGRHSGQITSVAFAPNGRYCATADNKDIFIWDVATGDLKYKFPQFHRAPIEHIHFTPQSKLLSEARDRTMALWNLGQNGAALQNVLEHRSGGVSVLGVNNDGTRVLFDDDRALKVLTVEQKSEGIMEAPSEASQFTGFALFSPDDRLVLAAGTGDNPLQLWKAPQPDSRGSLIARLALPPGGNALCGSFAPDGSFAVTGTQDHRVLVWAMPSKQETDKALAATVVLRDPTIDTDRKARIWAILTRPEGITIPAGDTVTLVIPPAEGR